MQRRSNAGSQTKIAMASMKLLQEKNVVSIVSRGNLPKMGVGGFFQEGVNNGEISFFRLDTKENIFLLQL